jgi:hypothetical protein
MTTKSTILKYHIKTSVVFMMLITVMVLGPIQASAQSATLPYQPRTQLELISYLQGVVATLQAQILARNNVSSSRVEASEAVLSQKVEVELSASFDAQNNSYVNAWFEYGFLNTIDKSTTKIKIRNIEKDNIVKHSRLLKDLQPGTVYIYRPVFELQNGTKYYGEIKSFGTSDVINGSVSAGGSVSSNGSTGSYRNSLTTDKTQYEAGEVVKVSWTTPHLDNYRGSYVYMFKKNDSSKPFMGKMVISETGTVNFSVRVEGTYEFKLLITGSSKYVATSRTITIK